MRLTDTILHGDCLQQLRALPDGCVQTCVTSPPYFGLRDYGVPGQLGLEPTPEEYVTQIVQVFREVRRVLCDDGTCWINLGDSYASDVKGSGGMTSSKLAIKGKQNYQAFEPRKIKHGLKPKDLIGIPWRVAFALQADGWYLRSDIIWHKPNCMPESVRDRPTKAHEYVFLLAKRERYYYDADAVRERATYDVPRTLKRSGLRPDYIKALNAGGSAGTNPAGRNKRDVWSIATRPYAGAHFAVMPEALVEPCILAGSRPGDLVLDPFMGSGTVGVVARRHSRHYLGVELNHEYIALAEERISNERQPVLWSSVA